MLGTGTEWLQKAAGEYTGGGHDFTTVDKEGTKRNLESIPKVFSSIVLSFITKANFIL